MKLINIVAADEQFAQKAEAVSEELLCIAAHNATNCITNSEIITKVMLRNSPTEELCLFISDEGIALCEGSYRFIGDFDRMKPRIKRGVIGSELLVKASKIKRNDNDMILKAVDATAGMGEDSFLLAAAGFYVTMYENNPIMGVLLKDTLERAAQNKEYAEITKRMKLITSDSISALNALNYRPDIVLLDPMFPKRQKSALVKKKFQLIHQFESPCSNEEELLKAAIKSSPKKIIVKRPAKGPYLASLQPSHEIAGKAVRYDCYINTENLNI